jgi:hypothetical protein
MKPAVVLRRRRFQPGGDNSRNRIVGPVSGEPVRPDLQRKSLVNLAAAVQRGADSGSRWKCKERGEWPDMGDSPALDGERSTLCVKD